MNEKEKLSPAVQDTLNNTPPDRSRILPLLRAGETLKDVAAIHWGIYWKGAAVLLLSLILMIKVFNLGAFLLVVAAAILGYAYLVKYYLLLALTDKRVIVRTGILNLDVVQLHYNRIESVEVFRPVMGRILGYGTVLVTGTGSRVTGIPFVANADAMRTAIDEVVFHQQEKSAKAGG
jgi:uncharacterized membrane protein YdbT with pleckstrin-like domain